jgi:hypothetical protein
VHSTSHGSSDHSDAQGEGDCLHLPPRQQCSKLVQYRAISLLLVLRVCPRDRVCQSSAPSFGWVNSSMKTTRRPQWTAQASGRFRRMLEESAASSPTRTRSSLASSSHIRCHSDGSVMESNGTSIPLRPSTLHQLWTPYERTTPGWPSL